MVWGFETEVWIIGFGGAGAVAATSPHDAGAKVLVVEKTEKGRRKWARKSRVLKTWKKK